MTAHEDICAELRAAFLSTSYGTADARAYLSPTPQGFCPSWAAREGYAILTAWNPDGREDSAEENAAAQARLQADLAGYAFQHGYNGENKWREETFIVAGIAPACALELGNKYTQAAIITGLGERAELVHCKSGKVEQLWWSITPVV